MIPSAFSRLLPLLGLLLLLALPTQATHIVGAEISYAPVAGDHRRYLVTAKVYRETVNGQVNFGPEIELHCRLNGCSAGNPTNFKDRLTRISTSFLSYTGCTGGPTIEQQVFVGEVNFPNVGLWTMSLFEANRTRSIVNLVNSDFYTMYAEAQVNVLSAMPANTSPVFSSTLLPSICGSQFHRFSFAAFDADGDSLVYHMTDPQGTPAGGVDFCPAPIPATPSPHFTVNSASGELATGPFTLTIGNYIMAVRVDEYRRVASQWTKIGSVMRDIMYPVRSSSGNLNPTFTTLTVSGTTQPVGQLVRVNPGRTVSLTLTATDQNAGQALRFSTDALIPGVTLQTLSATQARLTWQIPANQPLGRYTIPVVVADNACPINGTETRTLTVQVTNLVLSSQPPQPRFELSAYPMPFREQVRFQLAGPGAQPVQILDGLGRVVAELRSQADGTVSWRPAASLAPGLYLARTPDGRQVARLLRE
ncbi:hypothetical protein [Hymenobacter algoricola]|uniref:T9SS type A sorting domain-containing protein n=1 Tax=Hymenobacter algoricola TaxID=486267 RepID=A0ABP7NVH9_9BACT